MKKNRLFLTLALSVCAVMALATACAGGAPAATQATPADATVSGTTAAGLSDEYAIPAVTLCGTNTNDPDFMKGFSMQGSIGALIDDENIFSAALCYTTANIDEVKAFFTSAPFDDASSFLAEVDTLDLDGKIRNLADDRLSYLDGKIDDPIRFYSDAVDLINGTSLLQTAGEYHFYIVTMGYEKVLAVSEADKTFTMEQASIDLAHDFAAAFEKIVEARVMEDAADVSALTQTEKDAAVTEYYQTQVDELNLGITVSAVYGNDESYPDDYEVTLTKEGQSAMAFATVFFGAVIDENAELFNVKLLSSDASNTEFELMKGFQMGFNMNSALVSADNTAAYIMFYTTGDMSAVTDFLKDKTYADLESMDEAGLVKLITDLSYADGAENTFYSDAKDLINGTGLIETAGDYHFYAATVSKEDVNVVRYIAEADITFTQTIG